MYDSVESQITYKKNAMSFPDHVDNIPNYIEREYLWGRRFKKSWQFYLDISRMLPRYKNSFIGKENYFLKSEHDNINNIPF